MRTAADADIPIFVARSSGERRKFRLSELHPHRDNAPLVSCLMVSRGDPDILRYSLQCYLNQDYPNRQLVLVTQNPSDKLERFLSGFADAKIKYVKAASAFSLGELRNHSIAHCDGEVICNWDDDDLSDPRRVSVGVRALTGSGARAAFLEPWLIWWPGRKLFAISRRRPLEGSMIAWRDAVPIYPAVPRAEDTWVMSSMRIMYDCALVRAPELYCYTITGNNTCPPAHFEEMLAEAQKVLKGAGYERFLDSLAMRMPIKEYASVLAAPAAAHS